MACVSVHGANRLGTNSLVDLVVFGKRGGIAMAEYCKQASFRPINRDAAAKEGAAQLDRIRNNNGNERLMPSAKRCRRSWMTRSACIAPAPG